MKLGGQIIDKTENHNDASGKVDPTLVLGLGNPLMGDDGIGVVLARHLQELKIAGVRVIDAGMPGYGLVDVTKRRGRVVLIDAVDGGRPPGTVFWVDANDLALETRRLSLHQAGLNDVLALAAISGSRSQVHILGVQPDIIKANPKLSERLTEQLPAIADQAAAMIKSFLEGR